MLVYQHAFKFREPYQIIVDDEIVLGCTKASFDLWKGLARTVQCEVKPMITQCCMQALYLSKDQAAIDVAKTFERRRCNHREAIAPHECVKSIVNIDGENKHRYVVASENEKLRYSLRKIPGVPMIYMNRSVMVMEPLSVASAKVSSSLEKGKLTQGLNDTGKSKPVKEKKAQQEVVKDEGEKKKAKPRGPKQPNPLSMKKKKPEHKPQVPQDKEKEKENDKKRRKRSHKKGDEATSEANTSTTEITPTNE